MEYDSLVGMPSLEDISFIRNSLQRLQQLDLTHNSSPTILNPLTSKETCFGEELKIDSKWANMLDERKYYNTEDDGSVQTTRKPGRIRLKKVNIKSLKAKTFKN